MKLEFTGLRKEREYILPEPSSRDKQIAQLEEKIQDLEWCLSGNPASKEWQKINIILRNEKHSLQTIKNRIEYPAGMVHVSGETHEDVR